MGSSTVGRGTVGSGTVVTGTVGSGTVGRGTVVRGTVITGTVITGTVDSGTVGKSVTGQITSCSQPRSDRIGQQHLSPQQVQRRRHRSGHTHPRTPPVPRIIRARHSPRRSHHRITAQHATSRQATGRIGVLTERVGVVTKGVVVPPALVDQLLGHPTSLIEQVC
ncbi:hypothetical protein BH10ACT8_BH10ACT8_27300 [soil metagenome]